MVQFTKSPPLLCKHSPSLKIARFLIPLRKTFLLTCRKDPSEGFSIASKLSKLKHLSKVNLAGSYRSLHQEPLEAETSIVRLWNNCLIITIHSTCVFAVWGLRIWWSSGLPVLSSSDFGQTCLVVTFGHGMKGEDKVLRYQLKLFISTFMTQN